MLTADRILLSDAITEVSATPRGELRTRGSRLTDVVREYRVASVDAALEAASSWLTNKFLETNYGGQSSGSLYEEVVRKIVKTTYRTKAGLNKSQEAKLIAALKNSIADLQKRAAELSRFGFGSVAISPEIASSISSSRGNRLNLISSILEPYLAGQKVRLDNLSPLYDLVNTYVKNLNEFFTDKELHYSIRTGFKILVLDQSAKKNSPPEEIKPNQLSSGEQQLILLFCHVLVARDASAVFIIDEPELSLNILWQRMLVRSLQDLARGSGIQFIFASHSMEILSKHRDRVISMGVKKRG
jgi:predicted ATP-dependent endonuclease of OLD family